MTKLRVMLLASAILVGTTGLLAALPATLGNFLPNDGLGPYNSYRSVLLTEGWKPVPQKGADRALPEATCGNAFCTATWLSPKGDNTVSITLWQTFPSGDDPVLVLAPDY